MKTLLKLFGMTWILALIFVVFVWPVWYVFTAIEVLGPAWILLIIHSVVGVGTGASLSVLYFDYIEALRTKDEMFETFNRLYHEQNKSTTKQTTTSQSISHDKANQ